MKNGPKMPTVNDPNAVSEPDNSENLLDRLVVVYIWLNKQSVGFEHEYLVIETKDTKDGTTRMFILECSGVAGVAAPQEPTIDRNDFKSPDAGSHHKLEIVQQGITNYIHLPSRPRTPLSSMEEGTLTSTSTLQPLSYHPPPLSTGDTLSLSVAKTSRAVSDSLVKERMRACDSFLGDSYTKKSGTAAGKMRGKLSPTTYCCSSW